MPLYRVSCAPQLNDSYTAELEAETEYAALRKFFMETGPWLYDQRGQEFGEVTFVIRKLR